ncbi:MAG: response regulator [bacterium]|nr:response regulator [bacterium]
MSKKILIIDDSDFIRKVVVSSVKKAGFDPIEARNGTEGLDATQENELSLIICDVNMEGMSGLEFVTRLRETDGKSHLPVIMLTTESGKEHEAEIKSQGIKAWLEKPFRQDVLLDAIAQHIL